MEHRKTTGNDDSSEFVVYQVKLLEPTAFPCPISPAKKKNILNDDPHMMALLFVMFIDVRMQIPQLISWKSPLDFTNSATMTWKTPQKILLLCCR